MAEINEILFRVYKGLEPVLKQCGFSTVVPAGTEKGTLPATVDGEKVTVSFKGDNRALRMEYFDKKLTVTGALKEGEISDGDYAPVSLMMLDPEDTDDKQIRYFVNEINDSVTERFGKNANEKLKKSKMPQTVSRSKVENGGSSYDSVTLVSRFTSLFPQTKDAYKENFEKYGELLADEFFVEHGNAVVLDVIRRNKPDEMKKMFTLFNEMYLDGTGDTQSLIAVTVLGSMNNDENLLANSVDYMCSELLSPVVQVNKYLSKSESARLRLENPPKYKPKKKKKSFLGSRIGQ